MANEYMSPGGFLALGDPAQTGAIGMLGGAMAGQNRDIGLNMIDRAFRDSDLSNLMQKEDYRQKTDDVDTKLKMNELQRMMANEDLTLSDPRTALKRSGMEQGVADNQHKAFAQELDRKINVSNELSAINRTIGDSETIPPHMIEYLDKAWQQAGLPQLPQDASQARQVLKQFATMADQRIPLLEKERDRAAHLATAAIAANASMYGADTHYKGVTYAADKGLEGHNASASAMFTFEKVFGQVAEKVARQGLDSLNPGELSTYRTGIIAKYTPAATQSVQAKMVAIMGSKESLTTEQAGKMFTDTVDAMSGGELSAIDKRLGKGGGGKTTEMPTKTIGGKTYEKFGPGPSDWRVKQ